MILTFDLQNLMRSSLRANEYSPSVLSELFKALMRCHDNNNIWIWMNERNNNPADRQPPNVVSWPTMSSGECIK